ncbi:phosphopantetheine-binding protein [Xanthomonas hortorum pv. pelargonii]|nr:phosphopantetheine-binding protein [Xanthomonas hortorum pv. pelargonii]
MREAVVLAREDSPGLTRLVAYLTALPDADAAALRPATLRSALDRALPEHMLPSAWVVLPKLPLTANGKLDRKALPAPEGQAFALRPYSAPSGPTECLVAAHWCRLLGLPQVGRDDDFFALGGQSLLAVRLLAQLSEQAQVRLPLSAVFEFPTLAAFSRRLALAQLQRLAPDALAQLSALTEMDHVAR